MHAHVLSHPADLSQFLVFNVNSTFSQSRRSGSAIAGIVWPKGRSSQMSGLGVQGYLDAGFDLRHLYLHIEDVGLINEIARTYPELRLDLALIESNTWG